MTILFVENLEMSIAAARTLNSQLLVKETQDVYQQLLVQWPNELQAKMLADLFLTECTDLSALKSAHSE